MAMLRLQSVSTTTTAGGGTGGNLVVTSTTGMTRHAILDVNKDAAPNAGGWVVEIVRVVSATVLLAKMVDGDAPIRNRMDLSAIPTGAVVTLPEQWVPDLYSDDAPDTLAIPVKVV